MKQFLEPINISIGLFKFFGIVCMAVGIFCLYLCFLPKISAFFDRTRMHRPYTFMLGDKNAEYVTYERIGETRYKIFFHPTPKNPGTDYIITTSEHSKNYPPLWWSYTEGEGNQIYLDVSDFGPFWIDTIVSHHYEFEPVHYLLRKDTIVSLKDHDRLKEKEDTTTPRRFRMAVVTQNHSVLTYYYPSHKRYPDLKEAKILRH